MFLSPKAMKATLKVALEDVIDFLDEESRKGMIPSEWKAARKEAVEAGLHPSDVTGSFGKSVLVFLKWLEDKRRDPVQPPWLQRNQEDEPSLPASSKCGVFLRSLHYNLGLLVEPSEENGRKAKSSDGGPSGSLLRFAEFAVNKKGCTLSYNDGPFTWSDYPGFVSWLIVLPSEDGNSADIHILSNESKIKKSSLEIDTQARRFEKAILHELGHSRTNLEHYITTPSMDGLVYSDPEHETHAWLYAYSVKACISSERARISRLLRTGDPEWR